MKKSFHGRTYGAISATGQDKLHKGITPLLPGFKYIPFNNFVAMASAINNKTCAIMLEPIQGEGGVNFADKKYLKQVRELCDRNKLLLIFDEIQCGLGRTGHLHAYEYFGVIPDILLLGKALGGGLPLSALVTRKNIASALEIGDHGSTFGGNPVAAAAGLALLEELSRPGFLEQVREMQAYLEEKLKQLASKYPKKILELRGIGLMWGLELKGKAEAVVTLALEKGLIVNYTAGNVLRLLPPLVVGKEEIYEACSILDKVFGELK